MSSYKELKAARPIRHAVAVTVYRAIWWPWLALVLPFALIGAFVDWLSWTAFPAMARFGQPVVGWPHRAALAVGNLILGHDPSQPHTTKEG